MLTTDSKILVTGCGGMLGDAISHTFRPEAELLATDIDTRDPSITFLDVRDQHQVAGAFRSFHPNLVFHLAALTDVEFCEKHPEEAFETNARGTENIVMQCQQQDIPLVYVSTAGVFDGTKDLYSEDDIPHPVNIYGKSKLEGEETVRKHLKKFFIVRAGWMMGGGPLKDKKFVNKIMKQLREGKKKLFVVDDKLGCPTYTYDFAETLVPLINANHYGLYHMVGEGSGSRFEVAEELLALLGLSKKITLMRVPSSHFQEEYFAPRPVSERLQNRNLTLRGLNTMPDWRESLRRYLSRYDWSIHA